MIGKIESKTIRNLTAYNIATRIINIRCISCLDSCH